MSGYKDELVNTKIKITVQGLKAALGIRYQMDDDWVSGTILIGLNENAVNILNINSADEYRDGEMSWFPIKTYTKTLSQRELDYYPDLSDAADFLHMDERLEKIRGKNFTFKQFATAYEKENGESLNIFNEKTKKQFIQNKNMEQLRNSLSEKIKNANELQLTKISQIFQDKKNG